jgi:hypothetical protein
MAHSWRYLRADGSEIVPLPDAATTGDFPTQSEAESWIGEAWRALLDEGVDAVTLVAEGAVVYGPMSLHPAQ